MEESRWRGAMASAGPWRFFSPSRVLQKVVQPPGTLRFVPEFKNDLVAFANGRPWLLWWWSN